MNSLKNILVIAVLLGVGYAVYTTLNSQPGSPLTDQAEGWPPSVDIQMPNGAGANTSAPTSPFAARSDQPVERVPAREGGPWNTSSAAPSSTPFASLAAPPSSAAPRSPTSSTSAASSAGASGSPISGRGPLGVPERSSASPLPSVDPPGEAYAADDASSRRSTGALGSARSPAFDKTPNYGGLDAGQDRRRPEFIAMIQEAEKRLAKGESEFAPVHLELSRLYGDPILTADESRQLTELLDQLAGTVIYSRRHLLEPPYVVKPGDTLQSIAQRYNVPWQLLAKINGVRAPERLQPGSQLKVVRGPFEVLVSLDRFELTLVLAGRYAGRFPIGIGRDAPRELEGLYTVQRKQAPTLAERTQPAGRFAIELADRLVIEGTDDLRDLRRSGGRGVICLGPRDIEDLCDILTAQGEAAVASTVAIRR